MRDTIEKLRSIANDGTLSPAQKRHTRIHRAAR